MEKCGCILDDSARALRAFWGLVQGRLFPVLEDELGPLNDAHREFAMMCAAVREDFPDEKYAWRGNGRPPVCRWFYFKAFLAKAMWNFPTMAALISELGTRPVLRRLCGFEGAGDIPSEGSFSRVFRDFPEDEAAQSAFAKFSRRSLAGSLIHHVCVDSMAVHARESVAPNPEDGEKAAPGTDGGAEAKAGEPKRLDAQPKWPAEDNLRELPTACDIGVKRNSKGFMESWKGYKLHLAVADGDIPVAMWLTSASLHDSQAALPLMQKAAEACPTLYHLLDAAYDAAPIRDYSRSLGSVPIVHVNPRHKGRAAPTNSNRTGGADSGNAPQSRGSTDIWRTPTAGGRSTSAGTQRSRSTLPSASLPSPSSRPSGSFNKNSAPETHDWRSYGVTSERPCPSGAHCEWLKSRAGGHLRQKMTQNASIPTPNGKLYKALRRSTGRKATP